MKQLLKILNLFPKSMPDAGEKTPSINIGGVITSFTINTPSPSFE
jgi:hypothetical protein